jgi:hypothetical protein
MDRWLGDSMSSGYEPAGIWNEYVLYTGTTTSDGNAGKTTLICNGLVGENDFLSGVVVRISSGSAEKEVREISSFASGTGTITVGTAFSAQILSGITFSILVHLPADVDISALQADVGDASASTLGSIYGILGNPSASLSTTILDGIDGRANNPTLNALLGVSDGAGKSINGNIGDFQARTNLQTLLASLGIPDVAGKDLYTCLITDRLDNATYGLSALETLVDNLETRSVSYVSMMEFPSEMDDIITLTTATANVALPDIIVADIPANTTVIRAVADLIPHSITDTSGALNAINGAGMVQIQKSVGGSYTNLITIPDNILRTAASTEVGGVPIRGTNDASAEVTGNGTYNLKFNGNIFVDGNNLELSDVQVVLKVYFIAA